ncbi:unnamed protein product [Rotaria sp. Silwood1]|nr:unnamed protein product [Rotaria sp. Silwood1]CAF3341691.1 unnamed protein product [Rotaria sp. Silwood1]CAF3364588.1 unnamed protein product [Rotaria sp. Silwood1]CAF3431904.1 unnamed protein product [Rotaria sp. Silwood1]CAF4794936.1 unnamed protein product [Rotaria sp. Silwood1]
MPVWKINCLKSEDGTNPSTLSSTTIDETNKIESISSSIDHQNSDIPIAVTAVDTHSLPSTPSFIIRREQKQRYNQHSLIPMSWSHRLATLEPSPSFATVTPITTPTTNNNSSRLSPLEHRLAKYRSLPLLWLRTCASSNHQHRRRTTAAGNIGKNTIPTSLGDFGEFEN